MQVVSRRSLARVALGLTVIALVALVTLALPFPKDCESLLKEAEYRRAFVAAYRIALRSSRSSGVPLNGLCYTALIRRSSPDDIEVVFLPRLVVQRIAYPRDPEEIHVILRRPKMRTVRFYFGE